MKNQQTQTIFDLLQSIGGSGNFATDGQIDFSFPGLEVEDVGLIGFPVPSSQIQELIATSKKASFGKGMETVTDTSVRSVWEIDAKRLAFTQKSWEKTLSEIVKKVKEGLGINDKEVHPNLYKLLIYEKGDFFLPHKDAEKEKGMFGTLVITLPCPHNGGDLAVRFGGREKRINFSHAASNYALSYAAFFADCEHEVEVVESGYRVTLVYNLLQAPDGDIQPPEFSNQLRHMTAELRALGQTPSDDPLIFLLDHQYTPTNFSINHLKRHDLPRAKALLQAAEEAGYFAKLGLVTSYMMGELEGVDWRYDRYGGYAGDLEDGVMGEVYESQLKITNWAADGLPPLGKLNIDEDDLIRNFKIGEGEPIEKEAEGFTGNAGMTIEYWYHYGAVILWHKSQHGKFLSRVPLKDQLAWLDFYQNNWKSKAVNALSYAKLLLEALPHRDWKNDDAHYIDSFDGIAQSLVRIADTSFLAKNGKDVLSVVFSKISIRNWCALFKQYPPAVFDDVFEAAGKSDHPKTASHLIAVLLELQKTSPQKYQDFVDRQIGRLPHYLKNIKIHDPDRMVYEHDYDDDESRTIVITQLLKTLLSLSLHQTADEDWNKQMLETLTRSMPSTYVNHFLTPVLLEQQAPPSLLCRLLYDKVLEYLRRRTARQPRPPKNWTRRIPKHSSYSEWAWDILRPFMESPTEWVFDYQKNQRLRDSMRSAISNSGADLELITIKKGSPYTLRIRKNQASFEKRDKAWREDVALLEQVEGKVS